MTPDDVSDQEKQRLCDELASVRLNLEGSIQAFGDRDRAIFQQMYDNSVRDRAYRTVTVIIVLILILLLALSTTILSVKVIRTENKSRARCLAHLILKAPLEEIDKICKNLIK